MADVTVRMSAENAEMVRAWLEAMRGPQAYQQELDKIAQKGKRAGKEVKSSFSDAGGEAMRLVGALTGIGSMLGAITTAAHLFRQEYEAFKAREQSAMNKQVSVSDAFKRARGSLAGDNSISADDLFNRVIRGANGRDPAGMFLAFESGVNVAGDIPPEKVLQTTLELAKLRPDLNDEQFKHTVIGGLQLQKEFGASPAESVAGIIQSSTAAAPEDVAEYTKHMVPGIVQLRRFGSGKESFEDLAALSIGFGMRAGDTTGRRGTTNLINLARQVKEETLAAGLVGPDATMEQQLEAVRNNPELQQKLLGVFAKDMNLDPAEMLEKMRIHQLTKGGNFGGDLVGEARTFIPAVELLSPGDNQTKREIAAAKKKVAGLNAEAVRQIEEANQDIAGSRGAAAGEISRLGRQTENELLLGDPAGGRQALIELLETTRKSLPGKGGTSAYLQSLAGQFTQGIASPEVLRKTAAEIREEGRDVRGEIFASEGGVSILPRTPREQLSDEQNRISDALDRLETAILKMADAQEKAASRTQKVELVGKDNVQPVPAGPKGLND